MYRSPIECITTRINTQIEDYIFKCIQEVGVNVNKDELIKALQYDRDQYTKGYSDGIKEFVERLKEKSEYSCPPIYAQMLNMTPTKWVKEIEIDNLVKEMVGD